MSLQHRGHIFRRRSGQLLVKRGKWGKMKEIPCSSPPLTYPPSTLADIFKVITRFLILVALCST